ncbi:MAG TPA: SCO family protein [Bacilli bacterium]|nr:SCO family protein [Bacilli bacterium]
MTFSLRKYGGWITIGLLLVIFIVSLTYWFWWGATRLPSIGRAPEFTLQNLQGEDVSFHDHTGKTRVVEFFYASCPDVCPMTTANLVKIQNEIKQEQPELIGKEIEFYAISFDPEHDTTEVLQQYADNLGMDPKLWTVLHGTGKEAQQVATDFGMLVQQEDDGSFSHSLRSLYVVDGHNNIRAAHYMGDKMDLDSVKHDILWLANE